MPTGGNTGEYFKLAQGYGSDATNNNSLQHNLSTPLSGYYSNSADYQGSGGGWWSSTFSYSGSMGSLYVYPTYVSPINSYDRRYGQSMRCLMAG